MHGNEIGRRIAGLREARGLSQYGLRDELEKSGLKVRRETITQWENGTRDLKTEYTIKLAEFFGASCDYILRGVEAENIDFCQKTGLSQDAIDRLSLYNTFRGDLERDLLVEFFNEVILKTPLALQKQYESLIFSRAMKDRAENLPPVDDCNSRNNLLEKMRDAHLNSMAIGSVILQARDAIKFYANEIGRNIINMIIGEDGESNAKT